MTKKHRKQIAALPYRYVNDNIEILLITSRDSGRPVICKGWTEKKIKSHDQAAIEAFEEAGVVGRISTKSINSYTYKKIINDNDYVLCNVEIFPLLVEIELEDWPEKGQREKMWMSPAEAAIIVKETKLAKILFKFKPKPKN